jgi:HEAT repeat protein
MGDGPKNLANSATMAIALHEDRRATDRLITMARDAKSSAVRGNALFWVAQRAGDRAVGTITLALEDPETEIRKKAVFALSQLPKDEGVPKLIELARSHRDPAVRKQAMFWLGQSRDPRALAFFEQVLGN